MDSAETANRTTKSDFGSTFARHLAPSATIRPHLYNVVAYFVPTTFNAGDQDGLREIESANRLPENSLKTSRWIKPLHRRDPRQICAHAILSFDSPQQANKAIAEGLIVCHKRIDVKKDKREPIRCMKCQLWGHVANNCSSPSDTCGSCGQSHRSSECASNSRYCTPCKEEGHASWDRDCPAFIRECKLINSRNPDNHLTYFPTDEPWTYVTSERTAHTHNPLHQRPLIDRISSLADVATIRHKRPQSKRTGPPTRSLPQHSSAPSPPPR